MDMIWFCVIAFVVIKWVIPTSKEEVSPASGKKCIKLHNWIYDKDDKLFCENCGQKPGDVIHKDKE